MWKKWSYSLLLAAAYVLIFAFWRTGPRREIIMASGVVASLVLTAILIRAAKRRYFLNDWDRFFHGVVVFDILAEAMFVPFHDNFGFFLCALGFGVVIGGYRYNQLRNRRGIPGSDCGPAGSSQV